MEEIDRISSLPDCLIHQILSFLKTKESVRTTVLSKRWIHVWKSIPRLDLNASDFQQVETFMDFTNSIFHHKLFPNPEKLDTFNLTWRYCSGDSHHTIRKWLSNLVSFKPRLVNIVLFYLDEIDMSFASCLFDSTTLESLVLRLRSYTARARINPKVINLPGLKRLNLGWMRFKDDFIPRLVLGCPVLEELVFEYCSLDVTEIITSSTVKKLVICVCKFNEGLRLRICMPNLEYLSCDVCFGGFSFENLSSLEYASLNVIGMQKYTMEMKGFSSLGGLSNAKTLRLSGSFLKKMLEVESLDLPVFEKLKSLDLDDVVIDKELEPLASILKRTPNLDMLILRKIMMIEEERVVVQRVGYLGIRCDSSLKTVKYLLNDFNTLINRKS